jgi:hypothetical protein
MTLSLADAKHAIATLQANSSEPYIVLLHPDAISFYQQQGHDMSWATALEKLPPLRPVIRASATTDGVRRVLERLARDAT